MMIERMEMIDAHGDGLIQRAELTAWRERVCDVMYDAAYDEDALDREEYMAFQFGRGSDPKSCGPRYVEMQAAKAAEFDAMDAEDDGVVTRTPFVAYACATVDAADANGDGALTPAEFEAMHQRI